MRLSTYRAKAIPLIGLCLGERFAIEARDAHRGERGTDELHVVAHWAGPKLVGVCGLGQDAGPRSVWLAFFAVHPDYRGQGIGRRLLAATEELAREQGYWQLLVETYTAERFQAARWLYSIAGYRISRSGNTLTYRKQLI